MLKQLIQVRPGFESDAAAELAARDQTGGFAATKPGRVLWTSPADEPFAVDDLIFARQCYPLLGEVNDLPADDRVGPLCAALKSLQAWPEVGARDVVVECADVDDDSGLKRFVGKFHRPLHRALTQQGLLNERSPHTLYVYFVDYEQALLGLGKRGQVAPWTMGIPRLKLPKAAPSRAALKLVEALKVMVPPEARQHWLADGMTVVDLGAAPGGWTHVMRQHGAFVTAVDNGALADNLMQDDMVTHLEEDALHFRPRAQVQWLICDVIERPDMITDVVTHWFSQQWTQRALFTLKLPMKKRYQAVAECVSKLEQALQTERGPTPIVRAKQLYHNRSEVTVLAAHGLGRRALASAHDSQRRGRR